MPALEVTQNYYFSVVSSIFLTAVVLLVLLFVTEKKLGPYNPADALTAEDHPQFRFRALMDLLDCGPDAIRPWTAAAGSRRI